MLYYYLEVVFPPIDLCLRLEVGCPNRLLPQCLKSRRGATEAMSLMTMLTLPLFFLDKNYLLVYIYLSVYSEYKAGKLKANCQNTNVAVFSRL